jgi:hypothetical protein
MRFNPCFESHIPSLKEINTLSELCFHVVAHHHLHAMSREDVLAGIGNTLLVAALKHLAVRFILDVLESRSMGRDDHTALERLDDMCLDKDSDTG